VILNAGNPRRRGDGRSSVEVKKFVVLIAAPMSQDAGVAAPRKEAIGLDRTPTHLRLRDQLIGVQTGGGVSHCEPPKQAQHRRP